MYKDEKIGDIHIEVGEHGKYNYAVDFKDNVDKRKIPRAFKSMRGDVVYRATNPSLHRRIVKNWLEERVIPPERQNIDDILDYIDMSEYDELRILKKTGASKRYDDYWVRFNEGTRSKYSLIRGKMSE